MPFMKSIISKRNRPTDLSMEDSKKENNTKKLTHVIAYGFESYGFGVSPGHKIKTDKANIEFVSLDSSLYLDSATGVIVPSGIFERFKEIPSYLSKYIEVYCKRDLLLQREREILNLIKRGGWVCCLVDKIIDKVPYGEYETKECNDTDLVKKLLNSFAIRRDAFQGSAAVSSKNDEFNKYIQRYGVAKTIFKLSYREQDRKIIATIGESVVGVEFSGKVIFLPFHSTNLATENAESLVTELSRAIIDYLQKRRIEIPDWVKEFCFKKEEKINEEIDRLLSKANKLQQESLALNFYKGILVQSGDGLKDNIVSILRNFFSLNVTDVEDFKEDAIIKDQDGKELIVIEVKGTKGGIKRKYIDQLDINRERVGLTPSIPGLLIINDQMGIKNVNEHRETSVAEEQIKHARNMNILILRTVDLLFLMRNFEGENNLGEKLIDFCYQGGGRLLVDNLNITIVT